MPKFIPSLVSVVVPVYNMEKYLNRCVDSILSQTYKKIELILVNDGSKDSSPAICEEYAIKDSRVRVIHKTNKGAAAARNAGLDVCNGEYVALVDSDDWIEPDFIDALILRLKETDSDICIFLAQAEDETGNIIAISQKTNEKSISKHEMFELLTYRPLPKYIANCTKIYRTSLFKQFRFPEIFFEDESCHRIYQQCTKITFLNRPLYHYLVRKGSLCHSEVGYHNLDAIELHLDRVACLLEERENNLAGITLLQTVHKLVVLKSILKDERSKKRINALLVNAKTFYRSGQFHFSGLLFSRIRCWIELHCFFFSTYMLKLKSFLQK